MSTEPDGSDSEPAHLPARVARLKGAPRVSVLMPAYNCESYIGEAIRSILTQSLADLELLIFDDGSSDDTLAIARSFCDHRIRVWTGENRGKSAAINFLFAKARGVFSALMDADDVSAADRLKVTIGHLTERPSISAVLSGHWLMMGGRIVCPRAEWKSASTCRDEVLTFRLPAHDPTLVVRTEVGRELKFDEAYRIGAGVDFVFRLVETHDIEVIGHPLYVYRLRSSSATTAPVETRERWLQKVFDAARIRRSLDPFTDREFKTLRGPAGHDPLNELLGHFIDSSYLQLQAGNRRGSLVTAVDALSLLPAKLQNLKPLIYALSPRWLARIIRAG